MIKLKFRFFALVFVCCLLFIGCVANSQSVSPQTNPTQGAAQPKRELVKAVLAEAGIAQRYDLYLGNSIDMTTTPQVMERNRKFLAWLNAIVVQHAGWKFAESAYVTQLETEFSEPELQALLAIAKQPVVQKLLQAERDAYVATGDDRRKLFFKVWDDYNSGKFSLPPDVVPK